MTEPALGSRGQRAEAGPFAPPAMSLAPGERLAIYEVAEPVGAGGMGEVYRARDTKLGRDVALKVLPEKLAKHPMWLARFEREARLLAQMNHPHIAALYGLDKSDGVNFLVMELVPGETLAERIARGPIPLDAALPLFSQLADALEAAHGKGIIHRDLKPANVQIGAEENVKVLDFGVAKALERETDGDPSEMPTVERGKTVPGLIVGTAAYMSPEQARGEPVDRRTDIWSFGCCLFEALTAQKPFEGRTVSDSVAATLTQDPDWSRLPGGTPPAIHRLLRRCLRRERERRLHDIADARIELEEAAGETAAPAMEEVGPAATSSRRTRVSAMTAAALGLVLGASLGAFTVYEAGLGGGASSRAPKHFVVALGEGTTLGTDTAGFGERPALALSPDGGRIAYVTRSGGTTALVSRRFDETEAESLSGTEGASVPFYAPDGKWLGFLSNGRLRRVSAEGDLAADVGEVEPLLGASWAPDGSLVYAEKLFTGLSLVRHPGAEPEPLTTVESDRGERAHLWPEVLPGGRAVLFTSWMSGGSRASNVEAVVLETKERHLLLESGVFARYSASGHLLYVHDGALFAASFDAGELRVLGSPVPVLAGVRSSPLTGAAQFSLASDGTLAYVPATVDGAGTLAWVSGSGDPTPLSIEAQEFQTPRLSPNGERLAVSILSEAGRHLWIYDLSTGARTRLTSEGNNHSPTWSPDGMYLAFASDRAGDDDVYVKRIDGTEDAMRLTGSDYPEAPSSWSRDGDRIVFHQDHPDTGLDIWVAARDASGGGERAGPTAMVRTEFDEYMGELSPDGAWLAYTSKESGREEVYVLEVRRAKRRLPVSAEGGSAPAWSRDGAELYFRNGTAFMKVAIVTSPELRATAPRAVTDAKADPSSGFTRNYDVEEGGDRFLMVFSAWRREPTEFNVVTNWFTELEELTAERPSPLSTLWPFGQSQ